VTEAAPRVVLVTGAGTGIGRVLASAHGHAGARIVVAGRRRALLEETAALVGDALVASDTASGLTGQTIEVSNGKV
jgi:NADP-dependent 3-hydroxy acid dehydrogenase YdfG